MGDLVRRHQPAHRLTCFQGGPFGGRVLGGPWLARRAFLQAAGACAEGLLFPLLVEDSTAFEGFARAFTARFGIAPDYAAAQAYDSTRLLIAAIRKAGLNRARIRDAVQEISPWHGVSGTIQWDPVGQNARTVRLGTIRQEHIQPLPHNAWAESILVGKSVK